MISPIKTVVENCTERAVNYRFSCVQIFLGPAGTTGSKYVCIGDLFTRMENNVESELLVVDALNGRISISYECDDRFTVKEADRSPLVLSMSARNKIKGAQKVVPLAPAKSAQLIPDAQKKEAAIPTVQEESFSEVGTIPSADENKNAAPQESKPEAMTISNVQVPEDLPMGNPTDRAYAGMFEQTKTPVTEMKTVNVAGSKKSADSPLDAMAGHPDTLKVVEIGADKPKRGRRQVK